MPHDQTAAIQALIIDRDRLRADNAQLRNLIVTLMRAIKEVELTLQKALDKDNR